MKVTIKSFGIPLEIKNEGIELDVSDPRGKHIGDLYVTKAWVIWCKGRILRENGVKVSWEEFIKLMEKRGNEEAR